MIAQASAALCASQCGVTQRLSAGAIRSTLSFPAASQGASGEVQRGLACSTVSRAHALQGALTSAAAWLNDAIALSQRHALHVSGVRGLASAAVLQEAAPAAAEPTGAHVAGIGPLALYRQRREAGLYRPDARQELTASMLQDLWDSVQPSSSSRGGSRRRSGSGLTLVDAIGQQGGGSQVQQHAHKHAGKPHSSSGGGGSGGSGSIKHKSVGFWSSMTSLLGSSGDASSGTSSLQRMQQAQHPHTQGLYMFGGVGCGKTMLMDMFVETTTPEMKVLRTHFHDFMLGVHEKLRKYKGDADPLVKVADSIAKNTHLLALDEFFVTNVADAMILSRLFGRLWDRNVVLVATSNRHPDKLYENGLQRALFLPFIARLKAECVTHDMASAVDYRKLAQHQRGLYFVQQRRGGTGTGDKGSAEAELQEEWLDCAEGAPVEPATLQVKMGRTLQVQQAAGPCAFMTFDELCGQPVAAADYLALAERFHTLAVSGVPIITAVNRSAGYRFVTLIDILYEHRIRLLLSAEGTPFEVFENILTQADVASNPMLKAQPNVVVDDNLGFAKDRTISRLLEMQTLEHLVAHARRHAPSNLLALLEAQSKAKAEASQAVMGAQR